MFGLIDIYAWRDDSIVVGIYRAGLDMHETRKEQIKAFLEVLALVAPIICLVDCIVIPIVLAVLPFVGIHQVWHGVSDQLLALIAVGICTPVILPGYFQHRRKSVLFMMAGGFSLIFLANFAGPVIDHTLHSLIAISGSALLIKANFDNKKFSKKCACHAHHSHVAPKVESKIPVTLVR